MPKLMNVEKGGVVILCGNSIPWVSMITHLGSTITDEKDCLSADMKIKKAKYVSKNIDLNQEFNFAAAETRLLVNKIYNSTWYGSVL